MSELCNQCRHRQGADSEALRELFVAGASASALAELNRQRGELLAELRLEDLAHEQKGGATLSRRPRRHDWCAARSTVSEGAYYFCDWLTVAECSYFQCADSVAGCTRCQEARGSCTKGLSSTRGEAAPASPVLSPAPSIGGAVSAPNPFRQVQRADRTAPAPADSWELPLGKAYDLRAVASTLDSSFGSGSFQIDYRLVETAQPLAIRGEGLYQTYLIFGGPGAGKTHYFKYLLSSLLAHEQRPGCLLLDPKGALIRRDREGAATGWLAEVLESIGRSDDLTLLAAGASEYAFNVLGNDLPPNELGRLLSDVVLAGASGVDEGWAVLISDLLEAAAVVISADEGRLTAKLLLQDILYRKAFKRKDGTRITEYPIVFRARRAGRTSKDVDVRIACDRIAEYFSSTEERQRRFVRQIIERSLGELRSPDWEYLSSNRAGDALYSSIIHQSRVVAVAVGQGSPAFQRSMSTLVKSIFQQAALADLSNRGSGDKPFFILACDEYAQAITEGETGLVSDSRFFSLSREAGCMSLLALQSIATGRSRFPAAMHDRWDGILGNVTVKLFMRVNDVETAEMGSALAGSQHSFVPVVSQQRSAQGLSATEAVTMLEHRKVPPWYLTNRMPQGYALVHGTLDGRSVPSSAFVQVPT